MVRVIRTDDEIKVDPRQLLPGRGAYVHARPGCIEKAVKRGGLARAFKAPVAGGVGGGQIELFETLQAASQAQVRKQ